jgi:site-specific DNA-cytosine methylase
LLESESVQRDSPKKRASGKNIAADAESGAGAGGWMPNNPGVVSSVCTKWSKGTGGPSGSEHFNLLAQPVGYRWQNDRDGLVQDGTAPACRASSGSSGFHEMNHPVVVQPFTKAKRAQSVIDDKTWVQGQVNPTLSLFDQGDTRATTVAVAFAQNQVGEVRVSDVTGTINTNSNASGRNTPMAAVAVGVDLYNQEFTGDLHCPLRTAGGHGAPAVALGVAPTLTAHNDPSRSPQSAEVTQQVAAVHAASMTVRRLTPRECERLQGFPDDWTLIPWRGKPADQCPDGPRYKALGNSMAVNCMEWIGERIDMIEKRNSPGV